MRNHLFFFSTDVHASPFDVNIGLDAGYDVVIPFTNVTEAETEALTHDIIFSRGPKGTVHSGIFVGGSDMELVENIVKKAHDSIFEPFTVSIFSDPKGAYTTAAALVAKVKKAVGELAGAKVIIFGGTGPVGGIAAVLAAKEAAKVTIVTSRDKTAGETAAKKISKQHNVSILGEAAKAEKERLALMKNADIAIATVKAGVQVVSSEMLETLKGDKKIIADVNAVPPSGFGGLEPHDDMKAISSNIYGIGALAIGVVKYKVEVEIFKAMQSNKIVADYNMAYEIAQTLA
ncbi:MAG TPA: methylene-tetrahydromethanopterin dehydrogenase N-terminal domain-containing protein [Nitrospinota bacterium]|nr:methylene-tetrahydromethanopterin dehydrogenase N-terminal domain-containing protein [Nitrospinota bacterium]|tara:strand:- start:12820 stop:13686 length:867 start_codon:yes stop_codon:yes gene_type:complete